MNSCEKSLHYYRIFLQDKLLRITLLFMLLPLVLILISSIVNWHYYQYTYPYYFYVLSASPLLLLNCKLVISASNTQLKLYYQFYGKEFFKSCHSINSDDELAWERREKHICLINKKTGKVYYNGFTC